MNREKKKRSTKKRGGERQGSCSKKRNKNLVVSRGKSQRANGKVEEEKRTGITTTPDGVGEKRGKKHPRKEMGDLPTGRVGHRSRHKRRPSAEKVSQAPIHWSLRCKEANSGGRKTTFAASKGAQKNPRRCRQRPTVLTHPDGGQLSLRERRLQDR